MTNISLLAATLIVLGACSANKPSTSPAVGSGAAPSAKSSTAPTDASGKTMSELFHNKFPGVEVFQASNGGIRVKVRNAGAYNAEGGDPIYVVDGLEVAAPDGTLYIDPNNIVRIEVERVSSLYGIRGANGVIKITTKR